MAKVLENFRVPSNKDDFQATSKPPEAPSEGTNRKLSKLTGRIFLMKSESK